LIVAGVQGLFEPGDPLTLLLHAVLAALVGMEQLAGQRFDLIINGTAAGLAGAVPSIPDDCMVDGAWTYDMLYAKQPTAFVAWGRAHGAARALDGLGMLVEQAAESFRLWRGVQPDTGPVIADLRAD
jgi:shikimate dehydrogenase